MFLLRVCTYLGTDVRSHYLCINVCTDCREEFCIFLVCGACKSLRNALITNSQVLVLVTQYLIKVRNNILKTVDDVHKSTNADEIARNQVASQ